MKTKINRQKKRIKKTKQKEQRNKRKQLPRQVLESLILNKIKIVFFKDFAFIIMGTIHDKKHLKYSCFFFFCYFKKISNESI